MSGSATPRPEPVRDQALELTMPGSAALQRLMDEVASGELVHDLSAYNRTYHRHNR